MTDDASAILNWIDDKIQTEYGTSMELALLALREEVGWLQRCMSVPRPDMSGEPDKITAEVRLGKIRARLGAGE